MLCNALERAPGEKRLSQAPLARAETRAFWGVPRGLFPGPTPLQPDKHTQPFAKSLILLRSPRTRLLCYAVVTRV